MKQSTLNEFKVGWILFTNIFVGHLFFNLIAILFISFQIPKGFSLSFVLVYRKSI